MKQCAETLSKMPQIHSKIRKNALAAGALPQTPLGELTALPQARAYFNVPAGTFVPGK